MDASARVVCVPGVAVLTARAQDIWYLYKQKELAWLQYMQECKKHDFTFVTYFDHRVSERCTHCMRFPHLRAGHPAEHPQLPRGRLRDLLAA